MHRSAFLGAALLLFGCAAEEGQGDEAQCQGAKCDDVDDDEQADRRVCAAVRGNGQLIFAHFAALARITEHYGPLWGSAGGSSGSITQFLLESIQMNPAVASCGDYECARLEQGARISLMLKSLTGYAAVLGDTSEAAAFGQLGPLVKKFQDSGIAALAETDPIAAQQALLDLLGSDDLRDLINDELVETVTSSPDPAFHVKDIVGALSQLGSFSVGCTPEQTAMGCNPKAIFVRPGLLDFGALVEKIGRIADFYAGYGPQDPVRMAAWLDACAEPARGLDWAQIAALPMNDTTCGAELTDMITQYRAAVLADGTVPRRIGEPIGAHLNALVSTSVLTGDAVGKFEQARSDYSAAQPYTMDIAFDDVRFGYWGGDDALYQVESNPKRFDDLKTAKFLSLGNATWGEAMSFSPAEPGLARALEIDATHVSAGGWSDLAPTLVLDNLGCEEIVYVTRRGDESGFATGIAKDFGMDDAGGAALYDLGAQSSFTRSLEAASAVWCTDWNAQSATDLAGVFADAYGAPMESSAPFFVDGDDAYAGAKASLGLRGCSPGA
ncbi:MAG TPA: hypothetical protein VG755_05755 [Nannocystaceae bacterium]|nr:hypothetical protein [Nannocystaceae bacterium]